MEKDKIFKELMEITEAHGGILKADDVVEFAKNENTALHGRFEWDNNVAGHAYRLWQARQIIRVSVTTIGADQTECKAFVSLVEDRYADTGYRPMISILSRADLRNKMLKDALEEMMVFQKKYEALNELADVFKAMRKVTTKELTKVRRPDKTSGVARARLSA